MMSDSRYKEHPTAEQLAAWRQGALQEVQRIGSEELAQRLKLPHQALLSFLNGENPSPPLLVALSVYDFVEYPDLMALLSSYFYESYNMETGSTANWQPAVDEFIQGSMPGRVRGAAEDIRRFLAATPDDRVRQELEKLGSCLAWNAVPLTAREWIQAVHDRLTATRNA